MCARSPSRAVRARLRQSDRDAIGTAQRQVIGQAQPGTIAPLPEAAQGSLQQGHRTRLGGDIVEQAFGQPRLKAQPHGGGLLFDVGAQRRRRQRRHDQPRRGGPGCKVGAGLQKLDRGVAQDQRHAHVVGKGLQLRRDLLSLRRVQRGEEAFPLVDHEERGAGHGGKHGVQRLVGGRGKNEFGLPEPRRNAGGEEGAFAGTGRSDDRYPLLGSQEAERLVDQRRAPEIKGGVRRGEGAAAGEGAAVVVGRQRRVAGQGRKPDVEHAAGEGVDLFKGNIPCGCFAGIILPHGGIGVGQQDVRRGAGEFLLGGRPARQLGSQAGQPLFDFAGGWRACRVVVKKRPVFQAAVQRRHEHVETLEECTARFGQGAIGKAVVAEARVELGCQRVGGGHADRAGHGDHGGNAEVADQLLGQARLRRLRRALGALTGGEEDEMGQVLQPAQLCFQPLALHGGQLQPIVEQMEGGLALTRALAEAAVGDDVQDGVAVQGQVLAEVGQRRQIEGTVEGAEEIERRGVQRGPERVVDGLLVEAGDVVRVTGRWVGQHDKRAQIGATQRGKLLPLALGRERLSGSCCWWARRSQPPASEARQATPTAAPAGRRPR